MVDLITPLPDPPSRSTQDRQEFVIATDNWLLAIQTWTPQVNALALQIEGLTVDAQGAASDAQDAADRLENAAAFQVSFAMESWAALSAITGTYAGQSAAVFGDAGTHTDPVVGGTKANSGIYRWSVSPAGWKWIDSGVGAAVTWDTITGKPATFPPSPHTHIIADVTGLQTALDAKAPKGAIGSSSLTMATARILGRWTASTGAIQEITVGTGLDLSAAGVLTATGGGGSMVYPAAGIAVSTGSAWATSLAVPGGGLVGLTASQTLTNKTLTSPVINGGSDTTAKTGGTLQAGVTVNDTGGVTATSPGYRGLPIQTAAARTLVAADNGKVIAATGDVTVPSGLPAGFGCTIYRNAATAGTIIAGSGCTLRLAGTATVATGATFRTLALRGLCVIVNVGTNEYACAGNI